MPELAGIRTAGAKPKYDLALAFGCRKDVVQEVFLLGAVAVRTIVEDDAVVARAVRRVVSVRLEGDLRDAGGVPGTRLLSRPRSYDASSKSSELLLFPGAAVG